MITRRPATARLPRVTWRREATRSLRRLMDFIEEGAPGGSAARRLHIEQAVESLRYAPLRCAVVDVKDGLAFRRLIVDARFFVYYVYLPPRGSGSGGTLSIRSIKHAASQNPFLGVRETPASDQRLGVMSTRPSAEPAIA